MVLDRQRYDEIASLVARLLNELKINCIPIDPFEIGARLGFELVSYSSTSPQVHELAMMESKDGFSFLSDHSWIILYNDKKPNTRIRFTIAHEIGHILLDHSQASELAEAEANYFARYLIAPPVLIQLVAHLGISLVADLFCICLETATYALRQATNRRQFGKLVFCDADQVIFALFTTDNTEEGPHGIRQKRCPEE